MNMKIDRAPLFPTATPLAPTTVKKEELKEAEKAEKKADSFDVTPPSTSVAGATQDLNRLLAKFGLEQEKKPTTERRFAQNVRNFVTGLADRVGKMVKHTASVLGAFGLAVRHCTSIHDIRQLQDFAKLAMKNGHPTAVFSILQDVTTFLLQYPDEARRVMNFIAKQEKEMTAQKSLWMRPALVDVNALPKAPPQKADIVVIGGGISAAYMSRYFAKAQKEGDASAAGKSLLVLEKDTKEKREHMASLRNAGIVCTALDYIFDIDEIVGERAIGRIQDALKLDKKEATKVYATLMKVMHDATGTIKEFLKEKKVDVELKASGGLDIAHSKEDVEAFRQAANLARQYGLDWSAIEKKALKKETGIDTPGIAGALKWNDSAQLHPGKLVKALFDYAAETSKNVKTSFGTEFIGAKEDPAGGWILTTKSKDAQGKDVVTEIHAQEVIDAREAYAPYHFREARFSQIHIIDTTKDDRPMDLEDTHVCHGFTYMRKVAENKFLVGSGDFPLKNPNETPPMMASVALYAFANFMKVFPNAKFDLEKAWGGVFGLNHSEVPCVGELLKGWQVVGGAGGSGMNLTPAMGAQAIATALGHKETGPMSSPGFAPRNYAVIDLRTELQRALTQFKEFHKLPLEAVQLEIGKSSSTTLTKRGNDLVFTIDEATLDKANILAAPLFGETAQQELQQRTEAKADFVAAMMKVVEQGLRSGKTLHLPAKTEQPVPTASPSPSAAKLASA